MSRRMNIRSLRPDCGNCGTRNLPHPRIACATPFQLKLAGSCLMEILDINRVETFLQRNVSTIRPVRVNHDAVTDHKTTTFLRRESECVNIVRRRVEVTVKFGCEERLISRHRKLVQAERGTGRGVDAVMRCGETR